MPNLKINVIVSYISQLYLIVISIIILPFYIKYMGAEAYGLVGFFAMLQGFFNLLDFGLTPTISRQAAQFNAGAVTSIKFRQLYRSLSLIFGLIAFFGGGILFFQDHYIADHWLKLQNLKYSDVLLSLKIIAVCVALRWMTGLYRGVISGFEKIVWLSVINILIATLRFPGVLLYMYILGYTIDNFFLFQLFVALFEFAILFFYATRLLPKIDNKLNIGWSLTPVKPLLKFALTIAFTSSVWVLITQLDKFILSGILPLSDYGYFTLAVLVAGGVLQISTPISGAIMPRMAHLHGEEKFEELRTVYVSATQFTALIVMSAGIVLATLAQPVLYIWTYDIELANKTAPILQLYALGNAVLAISAFPYYLQYAKGNLNYHFIGNVALLAILVPLIIWASIHYGAVGAGWVWLISQTCYLFFWVSYVHFKIEPNINTIWFKSFLPSMFSVSIFSYFIHECFLFSNDRFVALIQICLVSVMSLIIAIISIRPYRKKIIAKFLRDSYDR